MSRIGKSPINVPSGVTVTVNESVVTVEGKGGTLYQNITDGIEISVSENVVIVSRPSDSKTHRAAHGLYRSLIFNMITGVNEGWTKKLELVGVGYRASNRGQVLDLALGFSHNISMQIPSEVKLITVSEKGKNPIVELLSLIHI